MEEEKEESIIMINDWDGFTEIFSIENHSKLSQEEIVKKVAFALAAMAAKKKKAEEKEADLEKAENDDQDTSGPDNG